jgi:uncharacterized protein (DUF433 family)
VIPPTPDQAQAFTNELGVAHGENVAVLAAAGNQAGAVEHRAGGVEVGEDGDGAGAAGWIVDASHTAAAPIVVQRALPRVVEQLFGAALKALAEAAPGASAGAQPTVQTSCPPSCSYTSMAIETVTADVDYVSEVAKQWWYRGRNRLVVIDTTVAAGQPITAESGVRVSAVVSRKAEGFTLREIVLDTGASDTEVAAALSAAA